MLEKLISNVGFFSTSSALMSDHQFSFSQRLINFDVLRGVFYSKE